MNPQPLIAVRDVAATSAWYQSVLGLRGAHGGDEYEMLMSGNRLVLQLHHWEADEHPFLGDPGKPPGNGVLLWFQTERFDEAMQRITAREAAIVDGPKVNPNAQHREVWLRDPNGYTVVIAGARGDLGARAGE